MKKIGMLMLTMILIAVLGGCAGSRAFQRGERYAKGGSGTWRSRNTAKP